MFEPRDPFILLVEDIASSREYLKQMLLEFGYKNIVEAADGQEALQKFSSHNFDLVISDYRMEPVSGMGLLRLVRQNLRAGHVPFIMITAVGDTATFSQAEAYGVTRYLLKPLHYNNFQRCVAGAIASGALDDDWEIAE